NPQPQGEVLGDIRFPNLVGEQSSALRIGVFDTNVDDPRVLDRADTQLREKDSGSVDPLHQGCAPLGVLYSIDSQKGGITLKTELFDSSLSNCAACDDVDLRLRVLAGEPVGTRSVVRDVLNLAVQHARS